MNWPNLELFSRCSLTRELFRYIPVEHAVLAFVPLSLLLSSSLSLSRTPNDIFNTAHIRYLFFLVRSTCTEFDRVCLKMVAKFL